MPGRPTDYYTDLYYELVVSYVIIFGTYVGGVDSMQGLWCFKNTNNILIVILNLCELYCVL